MNDEIIKVALIHGEYPVDGQNKNGQPDFLKCTLDDEYFHIVLMLKYFESNYKDNKTIQDFDIYTSANTVALYLTKIGDIVFLNTTNYRKDMLEKHGRHGIIMIPNDITSEQKETLMEFKQYISKYNEIQIWYDITEDNQAQMLLGDADVIDEFIKRKTR